MTSRRKSPDLELAVFDMTGTTVENTGMVGETFAAALQADGLQVTADEIGAWRGASKREAIRRLIERHSAADRSDARVERVYADFQDRLRRQFAAEGLRPIAGAEETFAWLRTRGIRLAFNTGFDRDLADLILGALKWDRGTVDAVVCGDEVSRGRPAPFMVFRAMERTGVVNVRRVATVGDTRLDLEAGWNAGVGQNIGVLSGAHRREQLSQVPRAQIVASVAALPGLWQ